MAETSPGSGARSSGLDQLARGPLADTLRNYLSWDTQRRAEWAAAARKDGNGSLANYCEAKLAGILQAASGKEMQRVQEEPQVQPTSPFEQQNEIHGQEAGFSSGPLRAQGDNTLNNNAPVSEQPARRLQWQPVQGPQDWTPTSYQQAQHREKRRKSGHEAEVVVAGSGASDVLDEAVSPASPLTPVTPQDGHFAGSLSALRAQAAPQDKSIDEVIEGAYAALAQEGAKVPHPYPTPDACQYSTPVAKVTEASYTKTSKSRQKAATTAATASRSNGANTQGATVKTKRRRPVASTSKLPAPTDIIPPVPKEWSGAAAVAKRTGYSNRDDDLAQLQETFARKQQEAQRQEAERRRQPSQPPTPLVPCITCQLGRSPCWLTPIGCVCCDVRRNACSLKTYPSAEEWSQPNFANTEPRLLLAIGAPDADDWQGRKFDMAVVALDKVLDEALAIEAEKEPPWAPVEVDPEPLHKSILQAAPLQYDWLVARGPTGWNLSLPVSDTTDIPRPDFGEPDWALVKLCRPPPNPIEYRRDRISRSVSAEAASGHSTGYLSPHQVVVEAGRRRRQTEQGASKEQQPAQQRRRIPSYSSSLHVQQMQQFRRSSDSAPKRRKVEDPPSMPIVMPSEVVALSQQVSSAEAATPCAIEEPEDSSINENSSLIVEELSMTEEPASNAVAISEEPASDAVAIAQPASPFVPRPHDTILSEEVIKARVELEQKCHDSVENAFRAELQSRAMKQFRRPVTASDPIMPFSVRRPLAPPRAIEAPPSTSDLSNC